MAVVSQIAERQAVEAIVREARTVHLYGNKRTPTRHDAAGDFTEVDGGGYRALQLDPAKWRVEEVAGATVAVYPIHTWRFTGAAGYVHGFWVQDAAGQVRWAERLDPGPFLAANPGDFFTLELRFGLAQAQQG